MSEKRTDKTEDNTQRIAEGGVTRHDSAGSLNVQIGRDIEGDITGRDRYEGDVTTVGRDQVTTNIAGSQSNVGRDQVIYNYYGGVPQEDEEEPAPGEPPYKGEQNFTRLDAEIYTGREELINECLNLLQNSSLLAITGQSKIGKSSFIRGGVAPALKDPKHRATGGLAPSGSSRWPVYVITPAVNPLQSLGASLTRDSSSIRTAFTVAEDMMQDNRSFALMARQIANDAGAERILLIIDEFEELFTICKDEEIRLAFIDNLMTAVNSPAHSGAVTVILGIKSIYLRDDELNHYEDLWGMIERNKVVLPRLTQAQLREVIEKPAEAGGWEFEQGLVDYLLREVGDEPGALPLLQMALHKTWQRRRGRKMTFSGYGEVGNIHLSLIDRAELVYHQGLNTMEQAIAQNLFMRLTELGEGTQDGRRAILLSELSESSEEDRMTGDMKQFLQKMADATLITVSDKTIHVSHESLIRQWPRLHHWIEENREELRVQRQLSRDAKQWQSSSRHQDVLYRGVRLARALDMVSEANFQLNPLEDEFLTRSKEAVDREVAEREAIRQKQLDDAEQIARLERQKAAEQEERAEAQRETANTLRRSARRMTWAAIVSLVLTIVALVATYIAQQNRQQLAEKSRVTRARELASHAQDNLAEFPQRALLLAIEAMSVYEDGDAPLDNPLHVTEPLVPDAVNAFRSALANVGGFGFTSVPGVYEEDTVVNAVTRSLNDRWQAAGLVDGRIIIWDDQTAMTAPFLLSDSYPNYANAEVVALTFGADDQYLYSSHVGGVLLQWDLFDLTLPPVEINDNNSTAAPIAIDASDQFLVVGNDNGLVFVWPINDITAAPTVLSGHTDQAYAVALSPDGVWLVTGSEDTDLLVYETADLTKTPVKLDTHNEPIFSIDFNQQTNQMVTAGGTPPWIALNSQDAITHVWDISQGFSETMTPIADLRGHNSFLVQAEFSPDGQWLVTASYDRTLNLYETDGYTAEPLVLHGHEGPITDVQFAADNLSFVTASEDGTVRQWYLTAYFGGIYASPVTLTDPDTFITAMTVDETDSWIAAGGQDGAVYLYNYHRLLSYEDTGVQLLDPHEKPIHTLAFSPARAQARYLASGGADGVIKLWSLSDTLALATPIVLQAHQEAVMEVVFTPDGRWLVSGGHEGTVYAWDLQVDPPAPRLLGEWEKGFIHTMQFTTISEEQPAEDTEWLVATSGPAPDAFDRTTQNKVLLWEYSYQEGTWLGEVIKLTGPSDSIVAIDMSDNDLFLAAGSADHALYIWDLENLDDPPVIITDYPDGIRDVEFSYDGELLAVSGWSKDVYVWDVEDIRRPRPPYILRGHTQWVNSIAIDPDGEWLASASHDGTVRLWELDALFELNITERDLDLDEISVQRDLSLATSSNLTESTILGSGSGAADHVEFSHSGDWIIASGADFSVKAWDLNLDRLMYVACATAGRALANTDDEWQRYFPDDPYHPRCTPATNSEQILRVEATRVGNDLGDE